LNEVRTCTLHVTGRAL